jgi:hypothetical protein
MSTRAPTATRSPASWAGRAFAAVARAVLLRRGRPDDDSTRVLGERARRTLGRADLPPLTLPYRRRPRDRHRRGCGRDAPRSPWLGRPHATSASCSPTPPRQPPTCGQPRRSRDWLEDHLTVTGGTDDSAAIKREGAKVGHSSDALKRARRQRGLVIDLSGLPRRLTGRCRTPSRARPRRPSVSATPPPQLEHTSRGDPPTAPTTPTAPTGLQSRSQCSQRQSGTVARVHPLTPTPAERTNTSRQTTTATGPRSPMTTTSPTPDPPTAPPPAPTTPTTGASDDHPAPRCPSPTTAPAHSTCSTSPPRSTEAPTPSTSCWPRPPRGCTTGRGVTPIPATVRLPDRAVTRSPTAHANARKPKEPPHEH